MSRASSLTLYQQTITASSTASALSLYRRIILFKRADLFICVRVITVCLAMYVFGEPTVHPDLIISSVGEMSRKHYCTSEKGIFIVDGVAPGFSCVPF